jgi:hypothetical protein
MVVAPPDGFRKTNEGNYYHDRTWQENTTFKALAGKPDLLPTLSGWKA